MPKKSASGPRDAVLNVRVPARLKFGLDLVARRHRESVADVIIRTLNDGLSSENGGLLVDFEGEDHLVYLLPVVWDPREAVRTIKLALVQPSLLTQTESLIWSAVQADDKYWAAPSVSGRKKKSSAPPTRQLDLLQVEALEADWPELLRRCAV